MKAENPRSTENTGRDNKERRGGELPVEVVSRKNSCGFKLARSRFRFPTQLPCTNLADNVISY